MLANIAEIGGMSLITLDEGEYFDKYKKLEEGYGVSNGREFVRFKVKRLERRPNFDQYEEKVEFWVTVFQRYNLSPMIVVSASTEEGCCGIGSPDVDLVNMESLINLIVSGSPSVFTTRNCGRVEVEILERV